MTVPSNPQAPHTIVIGVEYHIYMKTTSGELSGIPIQKANTLFQIECSDQASAIKLASDFLQDFKKYE